MKDFFKKPYDLLESKKFRFLFIFGGSAFGLIFLWVFEPYGLYNLTLNGKILAISLYVGSGMVLTLLHFFPVQELVIKKYTVLNTILWILLSSVLIGISSTIINSYLYNDGYFSFLAFLIFQGIILSLNIIPVSVFILIHYNLTLRKRLKIATSVNERIHKEKSNTHYKNSEVVLNSENRNEEMTITLDSLICISSVDNYIEVNYIEDGKNQKSLIRYSLSKIEQDNNNIAEIFRCHKSYIVNIGKVESVSGNAAGYKLKLKHFNDLIPVSRQWNKEIKTMF